MTATIDLFFAAPLSLSLSHTHTHTHTHTRTIDLSLSLSHTHDRALSVSLSPLSLSLSLSHTHTHTHTHTLQVVSSLMTATIDLFFAALLLGSRGPWSLGNLNLVDHFPPGSQAF